MKKNNIKGDIMVQYRYLGYGVTDEKGIAKLDHDPQGRAIEHSYTATGAGKVDIVASLDSEITDGSLVSETYEVIDAIVYENLLTENKTWNISLGDIDFAVEFIVHPTTVDNSFGRVQIGTSSSYIILGDLYANANCGVQWTGGTFYGRAIPVDTDTKVILKRTGTTMVLNVGENTYTINNMNIVCSNLISATITNNSIKDFRLYPI